MLEVSIDASSDCASGESWVVAAEDRMDAAWMRIGRGFGECERLLLPQVLGPVPAMAPASSDEGSPLSAEREDQAFSPVDATFPAAASTSGGVEEAGLLSMPGGFLWAPDPILGTEPELGSEAELEPMPVPQPELVSELAPLVESAPEPLPMLQPKPMQEPSPASQLASALGLASPAESVVNPEAFRAIMTFEMLTQMGVASDAEATVLWRVEGNSPLGSTAFPLYGGIAPTEVIRGVVTGRDPDPRAISGRSAVRTLRMLSPATEISRLHCAVMVTTPGVRSPMDMGPANGTLLRHGDGFFEEVTLMVISSLSDGDLIGVGGGTTIEFRV